MNLAQHKLKILIIPTLVFSILLGFGIYQIFYASSIHSSDSSFTSSTFTAYPLQLRTELNKTQFQEGEMIAVNMSLKNISNRTIIVSFPTQHTFNFNITDMDGKLVYSWHMARFDLMMVRVVNLEPDEEFHNTLMQDLRDAQIPENQVPLPKGTYRLVGLTRPFSAYYENWEFTGIYGPLATPPITIIVT